MIPLIGDISQIASPFYAAMCAVYQRDWNGLAYLGVSLIVNQLVLEILKRAIPRLRPTGHSRSFPSGHTAAAFLGAGFIAKRYGIKVAIPAFILAIFVGYSRIYCRAHWMSDVFAGAFLGLSFCVLIRRVPVL